MIEDSTLGFNVIDGSPTDSDGRHVHDNDGTGSAGGGCAVPRVAAATRRKGRNDRLFLEALHHHGECCSTPTTTSSINLRRMELP